MLHGSSEQANSFWQNPLLSLAGKRRVTRVPVAVMNGLFSRVLEIKCHGFLFGELRHRAHAADHLRITKHI